MFYSNLDCLIQAPFAKLIQIPISLIAKFPFVTDAADCPALVGRVCIEPWYSVFNSALWVILEVAGLFMISAWLRLRTDIRKLENEAVDEASRRQIRRERGFAE